MLVVLCMVIALGMVCRFGVAIQKQNPIQVWWFATEFLAFAVIVRFYL